MTLSTVRRPLLADFMAQRLRYGLRLWLPVRGNALDHSGQGNHGTVTGAVLTTDRFGRANRAYLFDPTDDVIKVAHNANQWIGTSGTVSAWVRRDGNPAAAITIVDKYNNTALAGDDTTSTLRGYLLQISTAGKAEFAIGDGTSAEVATGATTITDNAWHLVTGTYDGTTIRVYVDGVEDGMQASTKTPTPTTEKLQIGADEEESPGTKNFGGRITDVRIYARVLSAGEVRALHNARV